MPGSHVYAEEGTYTLRVAVSEANGTQTFNVLGHIGLTDSVYVVGPGTTAVAADIGILANHHPPGALTVTTASVAGPTGGTFVFHAGTLILR